MFDLNQVKDIQSRQGYGLVSIFTKMEKVADKEKNPIILKNLIKDALSQLQNNYDPTRVAAIEEQLRTAAGTIDTRHVDEGIAIFASEKDFIVLDLPMAPREQVFVGRSYQTRQLIGTLQQTPQWLFLNLSREDVKLYRGMGHKVYEVENDFFPYKHPEIDRSEAVKRTLRTDVEYEVLEDRRILAREVDEALYNIVRESETPLFVSGEADFFSYFKDGKCGRYATAEVHENLANHNTQAVLKLAGPLVAQYLESRKLEMKRRLNEAPGAGNYSKGLQDVWKDVVLRRIMVLYVEEGYSQGARQSAENPMDLSLESDSGGRLANYHEDIVDDIIEAVLAQQGEVYLFDDGELNAHDRIAALLRYADEVDKGMA